MTSPQYSVIDPQTNQALFTYTISRSKRRKTVGLVIRHAQVKLLAPTFVDESDLHHFVRQKRQWVLQHLAEQQRRQRNTPTLEFKHGKSFPFFGINLTLRLDIDGASMFTSGAELPTSGHVTPLGALPSAYDDTWNENALTLALRIPKRVQAQNHAAYCEKKLAEWFTAFGTEYFCARTQRWAEVIGVSVNSVSVRRFKARWGSCSSRGDIAFSRQLLAAPQTLQDYVIVHELCHRKYMNHSPAFWALVQRYYPQYKQAKQWFSENGYKLVLP